MAWISSVYSIQWLLNLTHHQIIKRQFHPLKYFKPCVYLYLLLWNKNQNSLSLALTDWSFLSSRHSHWDLRFQRCWPFSHRKIPKIPACTVTKFQNFSLFHQTLLYVGHQRRVSMTMATTRSLQGSHDHHRRCLQAWPSPLFRSLFFRSLKSSRGQAFAHFWWCFSPYIPPLV